MQSQLFKYLIIKKRIFLVRDFNSKFSKKCVKDSLLWINIVLFHVLKLDVSEEPLKVDSLTKPKCKKVSYFKQTNFVRPSLELNLEPHEHTYLTLTQTTSHVYKPILKFLFQLVMLNEVMVQSVNPSIQSPHSVIGSSPESTRHLFSIFHLVSCASLNQCLRIYRYHLDPGKTRKSVSLKNKCKCRQRKYFII